MNKPIDKKEIDLLDIWRIALKRKWVIIAVAAIIVLLAGIHSFTQVPLYQATATILVEDPGSNMLNIQEAFSSSSNYRYDYLGVHFNTQLRLLKSRSLAERVAMRMNLSDRQELQMALSPRFNLLQMFRRFLSFRWIIPRKKLLEEEETDFEFDQDPNTMYAFTVMGGLSVTPVEETRLVYVGYSSPHPVLAADIVNAVVEEFINYSVEMRFEATQQASEFLSEQIAQLRRELSAKEREIQKYGEEKNLLYLSDNESSVVSKFQELSTAFTQAQIERIKAETSYRELRSLDVDALPQFINNPMIQNLKTEYSQKLSEYEQKIVIFKPDYPEMVSLRGKLDSMKSQLKIEIEEAVRATQSEYRTAQKKETELWRLLEGQRQDVVSMNNNAILYNSLKIEVENKRNLLNSLVSKQNETLVSARLKGLKSSNIKIIDSALIPGGPYSPNTRRDLIVGLLLGLICGVGLAFFIDYLDNTIKGPDDTERLVALPSLGVVPYISPDGMKRTNGYSYTYGTEKPEGKDEMAEIKEIELINHKYPRLSVAEDYRTIRTSILFSHADDVPKAIAFSSAMPEEGKTATAINTAVSFAQLEKNVLLIDADMRKPRLHKVFKARNLKGLSSYLTGKVSFEDSIQKTSIERLFLMTSGPHPPNPAELLNSRRMKDLIESAKKKFNMVIVDAPPTLAVIDPVIIGSAVDAMVMVIRVGKTTRKSLYNAVKTLAKSKSEILGLVYNEMKIKGRGYYSADHHGYLNTYYESSS